MGDDESAARIELRALVDDYAWYADQRDYEAWAATFTVDGVFRAYGPGEDTPFATAVGRAQIAELLHGNDPFPSTVHFMANHRVEISGDTASGTTYAQAHHVLEHSARTEAHVWLIRYHDEYRRTTRGWKFATRELRLAWIERINSDVSNYPFRPPT